MFLTEMAEICLILFMMLTCVTVSEEWGLGGLGGGGLVSLDLKGTSENEMLGFFYLISHSEMIWFWIFC